MQPVSCGYLTCPDGFVCCESCLSCIRPEDYDYCPQECERLQSDTTFCYDRRECGQEPDQEPERPTMFCPSRAMPAGPYWCIQMDDGTCAWQLFQCVTPGMLCGESVGFFCTPFD
jgi:hypothetical protein